MTAIPVSQIAADDRDMQKPSGCVSVRGARENNLRNVDIDIPRDAFVVFTGISGSAKVSTRT